MMTINERDDSRVAVVSGDGLVLNDAQDALDLMATANYELDSRKLAVYKESICDDFFELRTGIAGEILQKLTNYGVKIAIIGNFEELAAKSKSLRDFIYECNSGTQVFFVPSLDDALERLHSAG